MIVNEKESVPINYLIHELIGNHIEFRVVSPFGSNGGNNINLRWVSSTDQIEVVSRIVNEAVEKNAVVLIGAVDSHGDTTAYFVGFVVEPAA